MLRTISYLFLLCLFCFQLPTQAQKISDVSKSNPNYKQIQQAVKKGYLPLLSGNTFKGTQSLSRSEIGRAHV